jgi:hypothetical protein
MPGDAEPTRADLLCIAGFAQDLQDPNTAHAAVGAWDDALYDHHVIDFGYSFDEARALIHRAGTDPSFIAGADLRTVRSMATFLSRAERFCDGRLDRAVESGLVLALTRRLGELAAEMPD